MEHFHVFLSHNSQDKPAARELKQKLQAFEVNAWLDEEQLVPGRPWQDELETALKTCQTAAVLIGPNGLGPWETPEMRACIDQFIKRRLPVIPVLLPGAPANVELPLFLQSFTWVDLRGGFSETGLTKLHRGISQEQPLATASPVSAKPNARSSLPRQPYFFGREQELAIIAAAIDPETRSWGALIGRPRRHRQNRFGHRSRAARL